MHSSGDAFVEHLEVFHGDVATYSIWAILFFIEIISYTIEQKIPIHDWKQLCIIFLASSKFRSCILEICVNWSFEKVVMSWMWTFENWIPEKIVLLYEIRLGQWMLFFWVVSLSLLFLRMRKPFHKFQFDTFMLFCCNITNRETKALQD